MLMLTFERPHCSYHVTMQWGQSVSVFMWDAQLPVRPAQLANRRVLCKVSTAHGGGQGPGSGGHYSGNKFPGGPGPVSNCPCISLSLSLSLINCFHRIAGAGTDIAELVAGARRGVGAPPPDCLALLTSYVTDVFWVEILSRADLVMQLLQPLSQSLTEQSKQEQEMINNKYF